MSKLVLMGSGETAPSMVTVHRELLSKIDSPRCCWIDTPYGFQENAEILSVKTAEFFQQSLGHPLQLAHLANISQPEVQTQLCYATVRGSNYIFSGPGSPSYALEHWSRSQIPEIFLEKLSEAQTVLVLASATVCSVGALCLPVYEIYKVGQPPHWMPGLDLLRPLGFNALVLPHYNNTVGGNHDTRFCYLGERRLRLLEAQLEADLWIWGVDEHTALIVDLSEDHFEVQGKGCFTLRQMGRSQVFVSGQQGSLSQLRCPGKTERTEPAPASSQDGVEDTQGLIHQQVQPCAEHFRRALEQRDGLAAAQALLDFEKILEDWSGDTDMHHRQLARSQFRGLLAQLGQVAQAGLQEPGQQLAPLVESLLGLRDQARRDRQFQRADGIRQQLLDFGIEVQDTPLGTVWSLAG